jgi:hypothetical protein
MTSMISIEDLGYSFRPSNEKPHSHCPWSLLLSDLTASLQFIQGSCIALGVRIGVRAETSWGTPIVKGVPKKTPRERLWRPISYSITLAPEKVVSWPPCGPRSVW